MATTFAEAWDLLLSDPIPESTDDHSLRSSSLREPSPNLSHTLLHQQSASRPLDDIRSDRIHLNRPPTAVRPNEPIIYNHAHSQRDSTPVILQYLEELRSQLDLLQRGPSVDKESDAPRLDQVNRGLQIVTDDLPTTVTASDPNPLSPSFYQDDEPGYRCWESCCRGRRFSNRSNLVRHQRERSGEKAKLRCMFCNARFSRSSARNAHQARRNCWGPRSN